jgi:hypothetical protein
MANMKTTDRLVVTVVQADGWHVKTAFKTYEDQLAGAFASAERTRAGVRSVSADLYRDYKGNRVVRVKVSPARREGTK